jgi:hypothetical protein
MAQSKTVSGMRATLLFILYPLVGEFLFIDTIIRDAYARRRIRLIFSLVGLAVVAISFAGSELLIFISEVTGSPFPTIPLGVRYFVTGIATLIFLILFIDEGWGGRVSLEEQIDVPEDRISLLMTDSREVFTTLNRILNAAQLRRHRHDHCDNSRLASYALTVLGEYLQTRVFSEPINEK